MNSKILAILLCVFNTLSMIAAIYFVATYKPHNIAADIVNTLQDLQKGALVEALSLPRLNTINDPEFHNAFYRSAQLCTDKLNELSALAAGNSNRQAIENLKALHNDFKDSIQELRSVIELSKTEQPAAAFDISNQLVIQYAADAEEQFNQEPSSHLYEKIILSKNILQQQKSMRRDLMAGMATGESIYLVQVNQESGDAAKYLEKLIQSSLYIAPQENAAFQEALTVFRKFEKSSAHLKDMLANIIYLEQRCISINKKMRSSLNQLLQESIDVMKKKNHFSFHIMIICQLIFSLLACNIAVFLMWHACMHIAIKPPEKADAASIHAHNDKQN